MKVTRTEVARYKGPLPMPSIYQLWRHRVTSDVYAVQIEAGFCSGAVGPLPLPSDDLSIMHYDDDDAWQNAALVNDGWDNFDEYVPHLD